MSEVRCPTCAKPREPRADLPVAWCADCDLSFHVRPDGPLTVNVIPQPASVGTRVLGFGLAAFFAVAALFQLNFAVSDGILNGDMRSRGIAAAICVFLVLISAASALIALQGWSHETGPDGVRIRGWPVPVAGRFVPRAEIQRIVAQPPSGQRGVDYEIVAVPNSGVPIRLTGAYPSRDAAERALAGFIG
jgi:hypothetical protein